MTITDTVCHNGHSIMVVPSPDSLPRYWLAVTDDGVSFMARERRDVIAAAVAHLDALDANPEEARWQLFESPEEEMARAGKRVVDYLRSLQAIEASAGSASPQ